MIYFYARVSSKEQNLERQLEVARRYKDVERVFCDKQSGSNFERPQYQLMKETVREGDEVVVKELDRLGRNKELVKEEIKWFSERGVVLRILNIPTTLIDFQGQEWLKDMLNNILIEVLASIAQEEREKIRARQREGIEAMPVRNGVRISLKTGRRCGRPNVDESLFQKISKKQKEGLSVSECCREFNVSRSAYYNYLRGVA